MPKDIPFEKKELIIKIHNPNNLPVIDFHELKELQGDLKITTPAKIEKLKNSIRKYGIFVPKFVWIDNGTYYIEDGHQTIKALTELEKGGYTVPLIPYVEIQAEERKDAGEKLLMINSRFADVNPETSFFKDFDIGLEFMEEIEIPELELDFEGLGDEIVEDEVPEVPEAPVTQVGDMWLLGKHRVLCGDATKAEDVERLMDGKKADMVMTSPPYWLGKEYEHEKTISEIDLFINSFIKQICTFMSKGASRMVINTGTGWNQRMNDKNDVELILLADKYINSLKKHDWLCRHIRIWSKRGSLPGLSPHPDYVDIHWEFIMTFYNPTMKYRGQNKLGNDGKAWALEGIWTDVKGDSNQQGHTASYPVEIPYRNILLYSLESGNILDPFLGSGTTIIAAHQLNRICYGMEIEPKYIDVTCQRFFNLTGMNPIRESDGKKWSELQQ